MPAGRQRTVGRMYHGIYLCRGLFMGNENKRSVALNIVRSRLFMLYLTGLIATKSRCTV